jgi:Ala-tRNA(Pro) deacylase
MRLSQFLAEHHVSFETIYHPPAFSAQKRAKYLHIPGKQVAKTVLLAGPEEYFLAVLPATAQVDTEALSATLGGPVRLATDKECAELFCDCEWGVVPPFATLYGLSSVLDASIESDALLVFEGHTHLEAIRMRCSDYERLERPVRMAFAHE